MFCPNCGKDVKEGARFCEECGAQIAREQTAAPSDAPAGYCGNGPVRVGIPAPGFSDRANDPEILAAVKKNSRGSKIFALIFVPLPLIGFIIYSIVSGKMELADAAKYGGIISAVFLVFALISFIRERAKNTYDGVVTAKKTREKSETNGDSSNDYTAYYIYVKTDDGKKKKIREDSRGQVTAWGYLNQGDRFRYHPQFHFQYELYDKSRAPYIACVSCGTKNPVESDRCSRCGIPLLK